MRNVYLKLFLSAFFWGGSAIAGKYAMEMLLPSAVTFSRFFIAAAILLLLIRNKRQLWQISPGNHAKLLVIALFGVTLCYYFYFRGLYGSTAFNAGIIEATIPLITLIISSAIGMEKISLWQVSGLIIAYLGVTVTVSNGNWNLLSLAHYNYGDILLLISTLCFGIYNVLVNRWKLVIPSDIRMFYIFFYGSLALLPWLLRDISAAPSLYQPQQGATLLGFLSLLFMAVGGSVLAYLFFNQGIDEIGATKAASFINLVPFITIVLSVCVLNESIGWYQWVGAVVIILGVMISNRQSAEKREVKAEIS